MILDGSVVLPLKSNFMTLVSFALTLTLPFPFPWFCVVLYKMRSMRPLAIVAVSIVTLAWMNVGRSGRNNKSARPLVVFIVRS